MHIECFAMLFRQMRLVLVLAWTCSAMIMFNGHANSASVPPDVKRVVTFIFPADAQGNLLRDAQTANPIPYGTGFFVLVKNETGKAGVYGYLVTAKHVLKNPQGEDFPRVFIRLDRLHGDAEFVPLDLIRDGHRVIYTHPDPSVDVAVVPVFPDHTLFDFKMIPENLLTTRDSFSPFPISEGSDVFFAGLFVNYYGEHRNIPVFRFGRVAMFPDQPIQWKDSAERPPQVAQLYLVESQTFGGNSGSPVFFYLGADRNPGSLVIGPPEIRLAGVIRGSFLINNPVGIVQTPNIPVPIYSQNVGIAAVTPAYLVREILFSDELRRFRAEHPITAESP